MDKISESNEKTLPKPEKTETSYDVTRSNAQDRSDGQQSGSNPTKSIAMSTWGNFREKLTLPSSRQRELPSSSSSNYGTPFRNTFGKKAENTLAATQRTLELRQNELATHNNELKQLVATGQDYRISLDTYVASLKEYRANLQKHATDIGSSPSHTGQLQFAKEQINQSEAEVKALETFRDQGENIPKKNRNDSKHR